MKVSQRLAPALPLLPAVPVAAAWVVWSHFDGAYFMSAWYPSALAALALLVTVAVAGRRAVPAAPLARLALLLLAGFVAWAYVAVLWSDAPGDGLHSANKLLLYLLVAWLLSLLPWTPRSAMVLLGAWVAGVVAVCAWSLIDAQGTDHIAHFFVKDRYTDPVGYSNAVSALGAMTFWPAVMLSYRRTTPAALRPLFLAAAVFLLEFSLLPQSRGSLIGLIATLPLFVLLAPDRLRLIPVGLVIGVAAALSIELIYDVYDVGTAVIFENSHRPVGPVLDDAIARIWLTTLLAGVAGVGLALLDRFVRPGERTVQRTRRAVAVGMIAIGVLAAGAAIANAGAIGDGVKDRWDTFKSGKDTLPRPGVRLAGVYADQRYDYWRVGLKGFREHPLAGLGTGGYERYYTVERTQEKPSRYAHDLWLRVLSETGIVGFLLLAGFIGVALGAAAWRVRGSPADAAAVTAAAVAASFYFFVHSSFDWIEEFPALASPALALPLVGLVAAAPRASDPRPAAGGRRVAAIAATTLAVAAALVALVPAYLSTRYADRAGEVWTGAPEAAFRDLDRAADLAPLSARPQLRAATLAVSLRDYERARTLLRSSLERENTWYAHFELALIASKLRDRADARREIVIAHSLNREDRFVSEALASIRRGHRLDPRRFNSDIASLNRARFTAPKK
jgi:O-antigen ligase/polysaccharide polymerase Wzy-like membrane protein